MLWKSSRAFRSALMTLLRNKLHIEVKNFNRQPSILRNTLNLTNIMTFSWDASNAEINTYMPLVYTLFSGLLGKWTYQKKKLVIMPPAPQKIGASIAVALSNRQPKAYKLLPSWIGVQLWKSGCKRKVCANNI